jgi:hypothetical protein
MNARRRQMEDMDLIRAIAALACSLALAGCSSNVPGFERFIPSSEPTLMIDSNPPGAEARSSYGGVCRTPCEMSVPVTNNFTVTYALDGYVPLTVPVRATPAERTALVDQTPPRIEPNPVTAELQPEPPPPPPPPPVKKRAAPVGPNPYRR